MPRTPSPLAELLDSPLTTHSPALRRSATVALAVLMLATRQCHVGLMSDASWAVFFLGGFYIGGATLFAAFMAAAVVIDYVATAHLGVSSYCLSPAYAFLLPAYASLWLGGTWAARHWQQERPIKSLLTLFGMLLAAGSLCFLISNASFYWLSARVAHPTLAGWLANFGDWYAYFLAVPAAYVAIAATVQLLSNYWPAWRMRRASAH
jgi:hypothetical protein